ncbi:hypothetical protein BGX38DRAFT_1190599 [Terfezia claveryi]|nr:hypothetical protein BGX38DRAFT_1190599 [Terfezia claveryi]
MLKIPYVPIHWHLHQMRRMIMRGILRTCLISFRPIYKTILVLHFFLSSVCIEPPSMIASYLLLYL